MHVLLRPWLYGLLYPVGAPLHSKGQRQASKDVTTAAVNLVSIVHVFVAVSGVSTSTAPWAGRKEGVYGPSRLGLRFCPVYVMARS